MIGLAAAVSTLAVVVIASPLATVVQERLNHGHSNDIRSNLAEAAFKGATESPVIGWGTTRRGARQLPVHRGRHERPAVPAAATRTSARPGTSG